MQIRKRDHPPSPTEGNYNELSNDSPINVEPSSDRDDEKKSIFSPHFYINIFASKLIIFAVAAVIMLALVSVSYNAKTGTQSSAASLEKEVDMIEKQLGLTDEYPVYDVGAVSADEVIVPSNDEAKQSASASDDVSSSSDMEEAISEKNDEEKKISLREQPQSDDEEEEKEDDEEATNEDVSTTDNESNDDEDEEDEEVKDEKQNDEISNEDIFVDQKEYSEAPMIQVLPESSKLKYRSIVLQHERHYRKHPSRLYVPRLKSNLKLSIKEFADRFHRTSQPVIVPFEAMRHLGFNTRAFTMEEVLKLYPNRKPMVYKYGGSGSGELDLGPAIYSLAQDEKLKKTSKGRNYPRNMKLAGPQVISKLTVQEPPYVLPGTQFMSPSLWFGSTTASTKFHSDCCDVSCFIVLL